MNPDYFRTQKSQRDSNAGKTEKHIQRFTRTNDRDIRAAVTPTEHGVTKVLTENFNLSLRLTHHRELKDLPQPISHSIKIVGPHTNFEKIKKCIGHVFTVLDFCSCPKNPVAVNTLYLYADFFALIQYK